MAVAGGTRYRGVIGIFLVNLFKFTANILDARLPLRMSNFSIIALNIH